MQPYVRVRVRVHVRVRVRMEMQCSQHHVAFSQYATPTRLKAEPRPGRQIVQGMPTCMPPTVTHCNSLDGSLNAWIESFLNNFFLEYIKRRQNK